MDLQQSEPKPRLQPFTVCTHAHTQLDLIIVSWEDYGIASQGGTAQKELHKYKTAALLTSCQFSILNPGISRSFGETSTGGLRIQPFERRQTSDALS